MVSYLLRSKRPLALCVSFHGRDVRDGVKPITNGDKPLEALGTIVIDQTINAIIDNTDKMYTPANKK